MQLVRPGQLEGLSRSSQTQSQEGLSGGKAGLAIDFPASDEDFDLVQHCGIEGWEVFRYYVASWGEIGNVELLDAQPVRSPGDAAHKLRPFDIRALNVKRS